MTNSTNKQSNIMKKENPVKDIYTIAEAAEILGLHEQTVRNYISKGQLVSIKTRTGGTRITWKEIRAFYTGDSNV